MVGFPIRAPLDQSLLTAPQRLSQLTTPFIAFWCQGIHRTPFFDLTVKIEYIQMSYYLIHSLFGFKRTLIRRSYLISGISFFASLRYTIYDIRYTNKWWR